VRIPADVLVQQLPDDESVFLNLATEEYYGLDATGTRMWMVLVETGDVDRAHEALLGIFDIDAETLRHDLEALVRRLVDRGLLRLDPVPPGSSPQAHPG
jgi:hypothetical protein